MKKTVLNEAHRVLGAKMVEFSGWEMPLSYQGILEEHRQVRDHIGIFDLSHMGKIDIEGPQAEAFVDYLSANKILNKPDYSATYTVWADQNGGSVDDLIVYRHSSTHYFVIANAANREKDAQHLQAHAKSFQVTIIPRFEDEGILAVQGPQALNCVSKLFPAVKDLKPMHFIEAVYQNVPVIISTTGYTGSGGVEIFAPDKVIPSLWQYFVNEQKVPPIGLGARDTLRLEMGYALYGHELSPAIAPIESVSAWSVKMGKEHFLGKEALQKVETSGKKRHAYGIKILAQGIAREGSEVFLNDQLIGKVTSGTYSPTLNQAIALILVDRPLQESEQVLVSVRNQKLPGQVIKLPFVNLGIKHEKVL